MRRAVYLAVAGVIAVLIAVGSMLLANRADKIESAAKPPAKPEVGTPQPTPCPPPSFDVVRINPSGDTVMAGRAAPKSKVTVLTDGVRLGEAVADERGEWVFVPPAPLAPGPKRLDLESQGSSCPIAVSTASVVLVVPERGSDVAGKPSAEGGALALSTPKDGGPSKILQRPVPGDGGNGLFIDTIDYEESGRLAIRGRALERAGLQLYLDNRHLGRATADHDGGWTFQAERKLGPTAHTLRVDHVDAKGKVLARVAVTFTPGGAIVLKPSEIVVVERGNSLWRIAHRMLGSGLRYTVIYEANREQIKDPDLIYPGQVFAVPAKK